MAVKLRLKRMGKKKQPIYKVVAADSRSPRDGKFIEAIGTYNPKSEPAAVEIKEERALYWLNVGAQPTTTVRNLLSAQGIFLKRQLQKKGLSEQEIETKLEEWKKMKQANLEAKLNKKAAKTKKEEKQSDEVKSKDSQEAQGTASEEA
ncbi:30S ribosomal protein S16 [Melioribacter sp. OK-6-Me]|uniref:30S ribosomal protein S16 n=1 Tax=unclassified Melioribacter TaxID=2627329 RepID=UPI003ED9636D